MGDGHRFGRRIKLAEDNKKQMDGGGKHRSLFCLLDGPRFPPTFSFVLVQAPGSVPVLARRVVGVDLPGSTAICLPDDSRGAIPIWDRLLGSVS